MRERNAPITVVLLLNYGYIAVVAIVVVLITIIKSIMAVRNFYLFIPSSGN